MALKRKIETRSSEKGSARGDAAKERLLMGALRVFAAEGYEGASTRALARAGGANIAAIPYYFGDKKGLYGAVLERIGSVVQDGIAERALEARDRFQNEALTPREKKHAVRQALGLFLRFLLSDRISPDMSRIFLREQLAPTSGFTAFFEETMRPLHETLTLLVAYAAGLPFPSEEATLSAHAILGQVAVFKTHKEAALRRLGWKRYGEEELAKIEATVLRHTGFILDGLLGTDRAEPDGDDDLLLGSEEDAGPDLEGILEETP